MALLSERAAPSVPAWAAPVAVGLLVVWVAWLVQPTLADVNFADNADEAHYLAYATEMHDRGLGGFRQLFRDYADVPGRWFFPNPLRAAYIATAGLWTGARGLHYEALAELSLLCHLLSIGVAYGFARRLFGDPRALGVAALVAFSPLGLGLARRALLDSTATLASLLAIWSFWELLRRPDQTRRRLLFGLAFAAALLVKETAVLLLLPFAAAAALRRTQAPELRPGPLAATLLAPLAGCGLLWLWAAGDVSTLLQVVRGILASPAENTYARLMGGGPWFRYVLDFLMLSPVPTLLAMGAVALQLERSRRGRLDADLLYLVLLIAGLLLAYSFFTKNVRYVAVLDLPVRALAVWMLWELAPARRALAAAVCAVVVALLCWVDYRTFQGVFVEMAVHDPMSILLAVFRQMVPIQ